MQPSSMSVLFVCIHNSARSVMAEALLRKYCPSVQVESAGVKPGSLNPYAVEVLREKGLDVSSKQPQDAFELYRSGRLYSHVITVCDEATERCPIFPSARERLSWSFPDPSTLEGTNEEKLVWTRTICDKIEESIIAWCNTTCKS